VVAVGVVSSTFAAPPAAIAALVLLPLPGAESKGDEAVQAL
jgi:hypothetical protein